MKITFIGAGYVGLVTGIMMADLGHEVTCLDNNKTKILNLKNNILPIYEEQLSFYLEQAISRGKIKFTYKYDKELAESKIIFITVGTPSLEDGSVDLQYIMESVKQVAKFVSADSLLVIKSTVPPGTCDYLKKYLRKMGYEFEIASNPEFLREGMAVKDFLTPYRLVIGTESKKAEELLKTLYMPKLAQNIAIVSTNLQTAELIKYGSNSFLAIKLAYINEMANLCEEVDANIEKLTLGIGLDPRIGSQFLKVGPGFGGSCFPKDTIGLANIAANLDINSTILIAAIEANARRPMEMVSKISKILDGNLLGLKIAILGLSFKAGTDDVRDSPAIEIVKLLMNEGADIVAYDPQGMDKAKELLPSLKLASAVIEAVGGVQVIIILTEWEEFKQLDWNDASIIRPIIIDLRNMLDPELIKQKGFKYYSIGRKNEH